ncbi:MAG: MATE family efflux transporter [Lachnospiraceae bacterium]|nr:MATE family efflux transporter [Lachnospiraceae bacterium]
MKTNIFSDKTFMKKLLGLTLPMAFQNLMLALVAATDAFMLGHIDQVSMAAVSLATQIQFIQNMILGSCVAAASILGAQYWGKGDKKTLNDVFAITLRVCGFISILFFLGCLFTPEMLMRIYTNESVLIELGSKYLRISGWSYLLTGISQSYLVMMKVSDHAAASAKIASAAVIVNIIMNAILIFGFMGIPALGVQGAAAATLIARIVEVSCAIIVSLRPGYISLNPASLLHRNKLLALDYFKCVWPLLGACLLWGIGFSSYTSFMGHLGTDAAAANSVTAVIRDLVCCMCDGLAVGGGILVGNELGAGKLDTGKNYGDRLVIMAYILGFISTGIMLISAPIVLIFIKLTPTAKQYLIGMIIVMAVYMIGRVVNTIIINGIFAAGGDTLFDVYSLAVVMWGLAVPLAALGTYVFKWPVVLVYAFTCLDEVGKIPWVMFHYKKYKWVKDLTRDM